jgi:hypothetical protein
MRLPEANRSMAFSRSARFSERMREAVIDEMFVLTTTPMIFSWSNEGGLCRPHIGPEITSPTL